MNQIITNIRGQLDILVEHANAGMHEEAHKILEGIGEHWTALHDWLMREIKLKKQSAMDASVSAVKRALSDVDAAAARLSESLENKAAQEVQQEAAKSVQEETKPPLTSGGPSEGASTRTSGASVSSSAGDGSAAASGTSSSTLNTEANPNPPAPPGSSSSAPGAAQ